MQSYTNSTMLRHSVLCRVTQHYAKTLSYAELYKQLCAKTLSVMQSYTHSSVLRPQCYAVTQQHYAKTLSAMQSYTTALC